MLGFIFQRHGSHMGYKNMSRNLCICQVHIAGIFGYYTVEIRCCKLVYKFDKFPQSPNQPDSECFDELNQQTAIERKKL